MIETSLLIGSYAVIACGLLVFLIILLSLLDIIQERLVVSFKIKQCILEYYWNRKEFKQWRELKRKPTFELKGLPLPIKNPTPPYSEVIDELRFDIQRKFAEDNSELIEAKIMGDSERIAKAEEKMEAWIKIAEVMRDEEESEES